MSANLTGYANKFVTRASRDQSWSRKTSIRSLLVLHTVLFFAPLSRAFAEEETAGCCFCHNGDAFFLELGQPPTPKLCDWVHVEVESHDFDIILPSPECTVPCVEVRPSCGTGDETMNCMNVSSLCSASPDPQRCLCWHTWWVAYENEEPFECQSARGTEPFFCVDRPGTYHVWVRAAEIRPDLEDFPPYAKCWDWYSPHPGSQDHSCGCWDREDPDPPLDEEFKEETIDVVVPPPQIPISFDQDPIPLNTDCDDGGDGGIDCSGLGGNCTSYDCCAHTWSIDSPDLGASIDAATGKITPGTEEGYITVRATMTNLVDASGENLVSKKRIKIGAAGACASNGCGPGEAIVKPNGAEIRFGLGKDYDGKSIGQMWIQADSPDAELATPKALNYNVSHSNVQVNRAGPYGTLSEIIAPEVVVEVGYIEGDYKYTIDFFHRSPSGTKITPAFVTWKVENPDASATSFNYLHITKMVAGQPKLFYEFEFNGGELSRDWTLTTKDGTTTLRQENVTWTTFAMNLLLYKSREYVVKDGDGVELYRVHDAYRDLGWGDVLMFSEVDPGADPSIMTVRSYYLDTDGAGKARKLKSIQRPDGSWNYYDYDAQGRQILVAGPWKSQAMPGNKDNSLRKTTYSYNTVENSGDGGWPEMVNQPRTITETLSGTQPVSKTYRVYKVESPYYLEIEERVPLLESGAGGYGHSANLRTVRKYVDAKREKLASVQHPDGRLDTYEYQNGTYTLNPADPFTPGMGNEQQATITHGCIGCTDNLAENKSTRTRTITDRLSRILFEDTKAYAVGNWHQIKWTAHTLDNAGRVTVTLRSDGTQTSSTWDCCSEVSTTDETGVVTTSEHDALGRLFKSTKVGVGSLQPVPPATEEYAAQPDIITEFKYDAMDRIVETKRSAAGIVPLESSTQYDSAGRVLKTWNEANLLTEYTYTSAVGGGRKVQITRPGGGTEITEYHRDGLVKSVTGTDVVARYYSYDRLGSGAQGTAVALNSAVGTRWEKTYVDMLGRKIQSQRPGFENYSFVQTNHHHNTLGQLDWVQNFSFINPPPGGGGGGEPGGPGPGGKLSVAEALPWGGDPRTGGGTGGPDITLAADIRYVYDAMGNLFQTGANLNSNETLDMSSNDRIEESSTTYFLEVGAWWEQTINRAYATSNNGSATITEQQRRQLTGLPDGDIVSTTRSYDAFGLTNRTETTRAIDRDNRLVTDAVDTPDSTTNAVTISYNGLVQSSTTRSGVTQLYQYDALGRQIKTRDLRHSTSGETGGWSETHYDIYGRVDWTKDVAGNKTMYSYDAAGRLKSVTSPPNPAGGGKKTYYAYDTAGRTTRIWGEVPQPVEIGYDSYGQQTTLKTFRGGNGWESPTWPGESGNEQGSTGTADVTTWTYDESTGLLISKSDGSHAVQYQYYTGGALKQKFLARGQGSSHFVKYVYDFTSGDLTKIDYWDGDPDINFTYDRLGRVATITDIDGTGHTFSYGPQMQLSSETVDGSSLDYVLTPTYQDTTNAAAGLLKGRIAGLQVGQNAANPTGFYNSTYGYDTSSRMDKVLIGPGLPAGGVTYNRVPNSDLIGGFQFRDSNHNVLAESIKIYSPVRDFVASVENKWGSTSVSKYAYVYDNLARRTKVIRTGQAFANSFGGIGDHQELYTYNNRNELTEARTHEGANLNFPQAEIVGRRRAYTYDPIGNRQASTSSENATVYYCANSLNQYTALDDTVGCPSPSQTFTYDYDGNMLTDGTWTYSWDLENRLASASRAPSAGAIKVVFDYDYLNRRTRKRVYEWTCPTPQGDCICGSTAYDCNPGAWATTPIVDRRFVYDGWNLLLELDALNNNAVIHKYTWGLDLPGTIQGAGGIGGLLAVHDPDQPKDYLYFHDASGNVGQLADLSDGSLEAQYEYDSYGDILRSSGPYAETNAFRFSAKYYEQTFGQYYFGYRYLYPNLGRWTARDPIEERSDVNLFRFVNNSSPNGIDPDGRLVILLEGSRIAGDDKSGFKELLFIGLTILHSTSETEAYLIRGTGWLGGTDEQRAKLREKIRDYKRRKDEGCADNAPLIVIGFSDGATAIYQVLQNTDGGGTPAAKIDFLAMIDMVREVPSAFAVNHKANEYRPIDLSQFRNGVNYLQQSSGLLEANWKGYYFTGMMNKPHHTSNGRGVSHISGWGKIGIMRVPGLGADIVQRAQSLYP